METFTEKLLMQSLTRLPIPASRLLLGVDNTSNPHHKKDLLRKMNSLLGIFQRDLHKTSGQNLMASK
jgi:hypothetical protein